MPNTTPAQTRRAAAWQNFVRSNWITAVWNWFLGLVGKAAEAVLAVTILYSTVQVFTTTDPHVDLAMFLAQQAALDIGGLGLIKLANQAKRDGLLESADRARKVSIILMVLMVVGVIVANVESKITTTQTALDAHHHLITTVLSFQQSYPAVAIVIEILLLIARGTMAVVYGFTIHDLASSQPEQQAAQPLDPPVDVQALISQAIAGLQAGVDQRLQAISDEQSRMLGAIQQMQNTPTPVPPVDTQAIIADVVGQFETRFTQAMKRLETEVKQRVLVSLAENMGQVKQPDGLNGTATTSPRLLPPGQAKHSTDEQEATRSSEKADKTEPSESANCKSAVYKLLDQDNTRQPADLARVTGFPRTTVWRHWNRYHEEHGTRGLAQIAAGTTSETV